MLTIPRKRRGPSGPNDDPDQTFSNPSVPNLAALVALAIGVSGTTTALPEGWSVFVETLRCKWRLRTTAVAPVLFEILTSTSDPTRQWWREDCEASDANPWLPQLAWQIGPGGNDEALGTPAAPLATFREFERRMRGSVMNAVYTVDVRVALGGIDGDYEFGPLGMLVIDGNDGAAPAAAWPALVRVDAAIGYIAPVPAGPEYAIIIANAVQLADWTPYVGLRVRCSTAAVFPHPAGPLDICEFWVLSVNPAGGGNNTARITLPNHFDPYDPTLPAMTGGVPAPGDFLLAENLLVSGPIVLRAKKTPGATVPTVNVVGFAIQEPGPVSTTIQLESSVPRANAAFVYGYPIIYGCDIIPERLRNPMSVRVSKVSAWIGPTEIGGPNWSDVVQFVDCGFLQMQGQSANASFDNCVWEACLWSFMPGINRFYHNSGFFNTAAAYAIVVPQPGAFVYSEDDLFGDGSAGGINIEVPGFSWAYQGGGPTINAGGAVEFRVLGANYTWAINLPYPAAATVENVSIIPFTV
jgi:hypothetical protein